MTKTTLNKQKDHAFGKDIYLLGADGNGIKYWLEAASWEWYWGFGYVETYTSNNNPSKAQDITSHQHITSFIEGVHNMYDTPKLSATAFTEHEGWILTELFKTFYQLKEQTGFYHRGGMNTTLNPLKDLLKNKKEENRINRVLLPKVFSEIYKILAP